MFIGWIKVLILFLLYFATLLGAMETIKVIHVVDGDTLKIIYHGEKQSVRLIGIDTPESRENAKLERDCHGDPALKEQLLTLGKAATAFVKTMIHEGDTVLIDFDQEKYDKYHRLLGYIYLKDGRFLNEEIMKAGYAVPMNIAPNTKYAQRFNGIYQGIR